MLPSFELHQVVGLLLDFHKGKSSTTQDLAQDEYEVSDITTQFIFGSILKE
jgi:hypothetical protein